MFLPYGDDIEKRHPPFATMFLMAINVLVYFHEFQLLREDPHNAVKLKYFISQWGLVPQELAEGKVIGLLSGMFLHGDLMHLLGNMFTFWLFAWTIEASLGSLTFAVLYLSWGIAAGATHAALNWGSPVPCVGASGAIFGIIGAYFVTFGFTAQLKCLWNGGMVTGWRWVKFEVPAGAYVFFWLIVPQLIGVMEIGGPELSGGGIAWYAHVGGFAAGAVSMLVFGSDALKKMRLNREGKWEIEHQTNDSAVAARAATVAAAPAAADPPPGASACQYCRTELDDSHKIDKTLYRCPNPDCRRLTYVTAAPALAAGSRR